VLSPVLDAEGHTVIPGGSRVQGEVVALAAGPTLALRFETVSTTLGVLALDARVLPASDQRFRVMEPSFVPPSEFTTSYLVPTAKPGAPGSVSTPAYGYQGLPGKVDLRLPAGTALRLELTRPVLAPGSRYVPAPPVL
jgi:hypothetical protein